MKIPLFDIDGTLIKAENTGIHHDSFAHAFKTIFNTDATIHEINFPGKLDNQIILEVMHLHGFREKEIKKKLPLAIHAMTQYFLLHKHEDTFVILPGVKKLLEILKKNKIPIGLLTGNVEEIGWGKMEEAGIRDFFDFGSFGNLAFQRSELIKIAEERAQKLTHIRIPKHDFVIIGDTPHDIECAKKGNIEVIAVATGKYSVSELQKDNPDLVVKSLKELEKILIFLEVKNN